jgi:PBSX family phage terminase large subunit
VLALAVRNADEVARYHPYGAAAALMECRADEVLIEGPAGTGKSYAALFKLHLCALKYPGMRALIARKTLVSLTTSVLVTFTQRVLMSGNYGVAFFGGNKVEPAAFRYPNGSRIIVGGLDKASKIMSSEYDMIYINECTEITESDWESLVTRNRYGVMPYQQLIADANPDAPTHWLNQRCLRGQTTRLRSTHKDNPLYWDAAADSWTDRGRDYVLTKLGALTGVRRLRLLEGVWAAAEGQVYDAWRDEIHVVERPAVADRLKGAWRIGTADWGWTNPGCLQVWAVDHDDRLILEAEHYHTRRPLESWWLPRAQAMTHEYGVEMWYCDPSEPAYIAQFRAAGLPAEGAQNALLPGINAVQHRLAVADDGRPRLQVIKDAIIEVDEGLKESKLPWCTAQEIPEYVWARNAGGQTLKDKPVDANNHGLDALRYAVAAVDLDAPPTDVDPFLRSRFVGLPW